MGRLEAFRLSEGRKILQWSDDGRYPRGRIHNKWHAGCSLRSTRADRKHGHVKGLSAAGSLSITTHGQKKTIKFTMSSEPIQFLLIRSKSASKHKILHSNPETSFSSDRVS